MIEPIIDFLAIISVGFGIPSIIALLRVFRSSRQKFLLYFAIYMGLLNLYFILILIPTYFIETTWILEWLRFIRYLSIFSYIPFLMSIDHVTGRTHLARYHLFYTIAIGSVFIAHTIDAFDLMSAPVNEFAGSVTYWGAYGLDLWLSLLVLILARKMSGQKRKAVVALGIWQLAIVVPLMTINSLFALRLVPSSVVSLVYFFLMLVQNAVPFLFLGWFMKHYGRNEEMQEIGFYNYEAMLENKLTPREIEIAKLICMGKANKEIASELFISIQTVKDHNYNIFRKAGVSNRVQLVNLLRTAE